MHKIMEEKIYKYRVFNIFIIYAFLHLYPLCVTDSNTIHPF